MPRFSSNKYGKIEQAKNAATTAVAPTTLSKQYRGRYASSDGTTAAANGVPQNEKKPRHKIRRPPPLPFADLFIGAKENTESDSFDNFLKGKTGGPSTSRATRWPLEVLAMSNSSSAANSLSVPADDTFDKISKHMPVGGVAQHGRGGMCGAGSITDGSSHTDTASLDADGLLYASLTKADCRSPHRAAKADQGWDITQSPPHQAPVPKKTILRSYKSQRKKKKTQVVSQTGTYSGKSKIKSYKVGSNLPTSQQTKPGFIQLTGLQRDNEKSISPDSALESPAERFAYTAKKSAPDVMCDGKASDSPVRTPALVTSRKRNKSKVLRRPLDSPLRVMITPDRALTYTNARLTGKLATARTRRRLAAEGKSSHLKGKRVVVQFKITDKDCSVSNVVAGNDDRDIRSNQQLELCNGDESFLTNDRNRVHSIGKIPVINLNLSAGPYAQSPLLSPKYLSADSCLQLSCYSTALRNNMMQLVRSKESPMTLTASDTNRLRITSTPKSASLTPHSGKFSFSDHRQAIFEPSIVFQSPVLDQQRVTRRCISKDLFNDSSDLLIENDCVKGNIALFKKSVDESEQVTLSNCQLKYSKCNNNRYSSGSSNYDTATSAKWKSQTQDRDIEDRKSDSHDSNSSKNKLKSSLEALPFSLAAENITRGCSVLLRDYRKEHSEHSPCINRTQDWVNLSQSSDHNDISIDSDVYQLSVVIKTSKRRRQIATILNDTSSEIEDSKHQSTSLVFETNRAEATNIQCRQPSPSDGSIMMESSFFREALRCALAPSPILIRNQRSSKKSIKSPSFNIEQMNSFTVAGTKSRRRRDITSLIAQNKCQANSFKCPLTPAIIIPKRASARKSYKSRTSSRPPYNAARRVLTRSQSSLQSNATSTSETFEGCHQTPDTSRASSIASFASIQEITSVSAADESDLTEKCEESETYLESRDQSVNFEETSGTDSSDESSETSNSVKDVSEYSSINDHSIASNYPIESELPLITENNVCEVVSATEPLQGEPTVDESTELSLTQDPATADSYYQDKGQDTVHIPTKRGKGWRRSVAVFSNLANCSMDSLRSLEPRTAVAIADYGRRQTAPGTVAFRLPSILAHDDSTTWRRRTSILQRTSTRFSLLAGRISCLSMAPLAVREDGAVTLSEVTEMIQEEEQPEDAKRQVLDLCGQHHILPLADCFTESLSSRCKKIGEGVYGEVFMVKSDTAKDNSGARVLKVMPIEGDMEVNGEPQKTFAEIVSEIIISMELSNLRKPGSSDTCCSFVEVVRCWCVRGQYMPYMLDLWDQFHADKVSENDRPDQFCRAQLYIVLEFRHAGQDLESYVFNNAGQALSVFRQVAYGLGVSESRLEFEHRDLHWGNVLVAPTSAQGAHYVVEGQQTSLLTQGVSATIIDFTLSRLRCGPEFVVYNNLAADPALFTATGDYQFDVYRAMQDANGNEWESFVPRTNVLWLHYLLDKLISECYYKNIKTKVHKANLVKLQHLKDTVLQYDSALALVLDLDQST